jgi:hypothetical protein
MINNLFPSECSYVCAANPMWCSFTDIRVAAFFALVGIILFTVIHLICFGPRRIHSFAGTEMGIDWGHYLFVYPIMMIIMFAISLLTILLFGVILRWIL